MSGVLVNGVQWEHCDECNQWVRLSKLKYEPPSEKYPYGRDIGPCCAK
jgi:hypothetical protein